MTQRPPDPSPDGQLLTGPVSLELSNGERLVLFEFHARAHEANPAQYMVDHRAEQRVLWDLQAMLESQLVEPINRTDYIELVDSAHALVADVDAGDG